MNSYNEARQALDPAVGVPFNILANALGIPLPSDPKKAQGSGEEKSPRRCSKSRGIRFRELTFRRWGPK